MITAAVLAALATACALGSWRFTTARWTSRAPRLAVIVWQSLGLAWGLATTGAMLAFAVQPYATGVLQGLIAFGRGETPPEAWDPLHVLALIAGLTALAVLVVVLIMAGVQALRARHRHRMVLALISRDDPGVPGVRVLDHPGAAAYCVPGLRSQVVVSEGALKLLSEDELAAVLAHESAHVRERHDLVLLPFAALRRALPWSKVVADAQSQVELLIEMAADDRARRYCSPRRLATALLRFGTAGAMPTPQGMLGVHAQHVMARVDRLIKPGPELAAPARYGFIALSVSLLTATPFLWVIPL
ncbi:M56 family metallopeptidase [Nonomuraea sp. KC401]|uniref:M56 family metallopeptidase n=1 Tax=unclassified Nonomuraea TaxID=2593643 RepID=UPI0010FCE1F3|nr:M56 family metallopeptidase [Nonomuraea sp. KC401]NBE95862.1 M48 family metalloprotease [Nonomuraea sp. K271]TLF71998.1 M56 family metallopeptidase [Nonomuraea sp. KC401]